jgi:hypothetical protein
MVISGISGISTARRLNCKKCKSHRDVIEAYLIRLKTTFVRVSSGLVGSEESDLGFPLHPECAIQTYADWYFLHGIFG